MRLSQNLLGLTSDLANERNERIENQKENLKREVRKQKFKKLETITKAKEAQINIENQMLSMQKKNEK